MIIYFILGMIFEWTVVNLVAPIVRIQYYRHQLATLQKGRDK